jgi:hypothetical protein
VWQLLLVALVLAGLGALLAGRFAPLGAPERPQLGGRPLALAAGAFLLLVVGYAFRRAQLQGASSTWDAWAFWLPKAKSLVYFDGIDTGAGGFTTFAHPYYPPLVPAMDAAAFRFVDSTDATALPLQEWILFAAFLAAAAALLARRVPPVVLWPSLLAVAAMPAFVRLLGSALADFPLAILFALAGICGALWLVEGAGAYLGVATVLLAGATLTKAEGRALGLLLVGALVLGTLLGRRRGWLGLAALAGAVVVPAFLWGRWVSAHDLPRSGDYRLGDLFDPGYLADRIGRLGTAVSELPGFLLAPDRWLLAVPLVLAAALVAAARRPDLAVFAGAVLVLGFAGLATIYWIGQPPVEFYLETSAERTAASLALFSGSLLPLLLAEALR